VAAVEEGFFSVHTAEETLKFNPEDYDLALATEPFTCNAPLTRIDPIVIRNRDEIMFREDAEECRGYAFERNGADGLVDLL